jgi:hypothetical protein
MKRLAFLVIFTAACGTEQSGSLLTHGMSADITASSDGTTTNVIAELFAGDESQLIFVELSDGDQLIASRATRSRR